MGDLPLQHHQFSFIVAAFDVFWVSSSMPTHYSPSSIEALHGASEHMHISYSNQYSHLPITTALIDGQVTGMIDEEIVRNLGFVEIVLLSTSYEHFITPSTFMRLGISCIKLSTKETSKILHASKDVRAQAWKIQPSRFRAFAPGVVTGKP